MLRIAQLTDLHLGKNGQHYLNLDVRERFLAALAAARAVNPDILFITGDCCLSEPEAAVYEWLSTQLADQKCPTLFLAGNHDDPALMREYFSIPGAINDTLDYSLHHKGLDIIALDTSQGEVQPGQLAWLQHQLSIATHPTIFMHHPPGPVGSKYMDTHHVLRNSHPLLDLLFADGRSINIFCGHYHSPMSVSLGNLMVHIGPPTSFFINPLSDEFQTDALPAGFQVIQWQDGDFSVLPRFVQG